MLEAGPVPSESEVMSYFETCCNWDRWGEDDSVGTVNLITEEKRREAAATVRTGRAVSLAFPLNTVGGPGNWNPAQHFMRIGAEFCADYIGLLFHGYATTHIDALCHVFWQGKMWNGRPTTDVTPIGARSGAVDAWSSGITTRGVLIDIPRFRGVPFVNVDEPVRGWEIEAAAKKQNVELRSGDAVMVHSGRAAYLAANPSAAPGTPPSPGLHVDCIPVLRQHDIALLGWDMLDATPSGYGSLSLPVHVLAIVYMGMPLLDNARLEPLAEACVQENRWEFMLNVAPLNVRGGTGSPVNPIAIF